MNYADFQVYYTRRLWRTGDAAFTTDLPEMIRKAEGKINRTLDHTDLQLSQTGQITEPRIALPADLKTVSSLKFTLQPNAMTFIQTSAFREYQRLYEEGNRGIYGDKRFRGIYASIFDGYINVLTDASPEVPEDYILDYYMGITPYADDPATPFRDIHTDFYETAVDVYAHEYLRDKDAEMAAIQKYDKLLEEMITDSNYRMYPPGQLENAMIPAGVK